MEKKMQKQKHHVEEVINQPINHKQTNQPTKQSISPVNVLFIVTSHKHVCVPELFVVCCVDVDDG